MTANASDLIAAQIAAHLTSFDEAISRHLLCNQSSAYHLCPDWWREAELAWQKNVTSQLAARLAVHARTYSEFLPTSRPPTLHKLMGTVKHAKRPWPIMGYWAPDFSCGPALQRTAS